MTRNKSPKIAVLQKDKIRKLTWKYFAQRKGIELAILIALLFIPYIIGRVIMPPQTHIL